MTSNNDFVEKTTISAYIMLLLALFTDSPIATRLSFTSTSSCAKCGTIKKSGKRSCCARGGAWFKNCGTDDDTKFDHTWIEGINSCIAFGSSDLLTTTKKVVPLHARFFAHPMNTSQMRSSNQEDTNVHHASSMSNDGTANPGRFVELTQITVFIYGVIIPCVS